MLEGVADLRGEVDGVGVGGRIERLAVGRGCQQESEKEAQSLDAAFYFSSPESRSVDGYRILIVLRCYLVVDDTWLDDSFYWTCDSVDYTLWHRELFDAL